MTAPCPACGHDPAAIVTASWSMFVALDSASMNSHVVNAGASRWAYKRVRDDWSLILRNAMRVSGVTQATAFRRLTITRCYSGRQRLLDKDNYIGGLKPVADTLVKLGALVDDDAKHAEIGYRQERTTPTGIRFELEEIQR